MKQAATFAIVFCLLFVSTACITSQCFARQPKNTHSTKIEGQWKLLQALPVNAETDKIPVIHFMIAGQHFVGNNGCNNFSGKLLLTNTRLSFKEQTVLTQYNCQGYDEDAFMARLIKVNQYRIKNGVLELMVNGKILSRWSRWEPNNTVNKE